jgi:ABC-type uncharacterized transport system permease subunit
MEHWWLAVATVLAAVAGGCGLQALRRGRRSRLVVLWLGAGFVFQFVFLLLRGKLREACPLGDPGEILAFMAWSLVLFYLIIGRAYRWSPMGIFTAPLVMVIQGIALLPGMLVAEPASMTGGSPWSEAHAAMSVLSYGALALAAVVGVMFLVLDRQLKEHHLQSGWFRVLPPVRALLVAMVRLLRAGVLTLTVGIGCGWMAASGGAEGSKGHLIAALVAWAGYFAVLLVQHFRGISGRRLAILAVLMFVVSLSVFALL